MSDFLQTMIPIVTVSAGSILLGLGTYQLVNPTFVFWPAPSDQQWKKRLFMALFRIMVYGLVAASGLHVLHDGMRVTSPMGLIAGLLLVLGFAIAFAATGSLGWSSAFGAREGLRTDGIFRYSRNPIYLSTWLGLAGWALLIPAPLIVATLLCWALLYLVAIVLEERWLARQYGAAYQDYCRSVRRIL